MVKRTMVVLGILSLMIVAAGTSQAFVGGAGWDMTYSCPPLFVPVACPPVPESRTIVKTWSCKIEGPCPPPFPAVSGTGYGDDPYGPFGTPYSRFGLRGGLLAAVATPFDMLFGGFDGVYGCSFGGKEGPCGPCFGPIPQIAAGVGMFLAAPTMLGGLW